MSSIHLKFITQAQSHENLTHKQEKQQSIEEYPEIKEMMHLEGDINLYAKVKY